MIILEVSKLSSIEGFANVQPFIYEVRPGGLQLATFWTGTFGAPDESRPFVITISTFIRALNVKYNIVSSFNDCVIQEGSFYWDNTNQILYIHFEHDQEGLTDTYETGSFQGFSDSGMLYIDSQEYTPLIESVPSIAQQQDIINYDLPAYINGSVILNNRLYNSSSGQLDTFILQNVYGNNATLYYFPDDKITYPNTGDRNHLVPLAPLYVEDYDISLQNIDLRLQDIRKSDNISIPTDKFDYPNMGDQNGEVIPLMYGQVREAKAICTNPEITTGVVNYRVALTLTVLGSVQVNIDDLWTTVTPDSSALATGEFVLSSANGRNTNGSVRECRVLLPTGIAITYTTDIIKDLYLRYKGLQFIDSNFDTAEWATEEVGLSTGGVVFDSQIKLFEAIRIIQNGSITGFRFEINALGLRTFRLDNPSRVTVGRITPVDIANRDSMPVTTDSDQVFADVVVSFNKSFNSGRYERVNNNTYSQSVLARYRDQKTLNVETILNNSTHADTRALNDATKFKDIPQVMTLELMGADFLPIRIYDIFDIEATPDFADADTSTIIGREYYGFKKGKVISIDPDIKNVTNTIQFLLLEE